MASHPRADEEPAGGQAPPAAVGERASDSLPPSGMRLAPDPDTRRLEGGRILLGGSPPRLVRLGHGGARLVDAWYAGSPVSESTSARRLARRLLEAGLFHPRPVGGPEALDVTVGGPEALDVTVVVPVRDRPAELARCLEDLHSPSPVVVVDDGSADPAAVVRVARAAGARCVRRSRSDGPAAARNTGLAAAGTPFVAFLDSDCVPRPGWLTALLPHFADPGVAAVAPRIVAHDPGRGWLASYETVRSALDMGPRESIVRPQARVPYVPSAALVVRRTAAADGFDEQLRVGEDVDLVWRIAADGWQVRYEPSGTVAHEHRVRLREWFARRVAYGTSAAPLSKRHPGVLPAVSMSGWSAAAWACAALGRPLPGLGVTAAATVMLARRLNLPPGQAWPVASRLAGAGTLRGGEVLGRTVSRTWWPVALPAALAFRRCRLPLVAALAVPPLLDWARTSTAGAGQELPSRWWAGPVARMLRVRGRAGTRGGPPMAALPFVAARLLDDVAYSLGVWTGCGRHRTAAPLVPALSWRSPRGKPT